MLEDLIAEYPSHPEAYLKYWNKCYREQRNSTKCLDIADQMFIYGTDFSTFEARVLITLVYTKTLFK